MQALDTMDIASTMPPLYLKLHRDLSILIDIPSGMVYQLQQFAIDNDIVTAETGFPKVAEAIYEIYRILKIPKTYEEYQHFELILGFSIRQGGNGSPTVASSMIEAIYAFLAMHTSPGMEEIRDTFETTTLNYINFCLGCGISNYAVRWRALSIN